jgi:NADH dehydrogenase/NADH:ubiquinone oxidoreductase subunit G
MPKLTINDIEIEVDKEATILDAARKLDVHIPTLCHMDLETFKVEHKIGSCRVCMVEVDNKGRKRMMPACSTPVADGIKISTNVPEVVQARRTVLELILSDHPAKTA